MRKGIIKEKEPQTLSRWEVIKAWIAESIASIKRSLKDGGWKGTALGAATLTSAVSAGIVLVACVPTEVQIEEVTSESEVNRLVSANFSEEDAVRDEMTKQFGALSDFEYNNGKATANVEKDGKSYAVSAEIDLGASDFEVTKYTNAERSGNNLTYTSEGQDVSENVSDKIVVEENGVIYVIDPSGALNTISIAVSDAILTENVDPENPGGEDKPDPDEPENPGGEENPDPDEPENPGGEDKPDPDEPENPGGEENPDPDKPGEGEEGKPDEGGEGEPDPGEPTKITFDSWQELMSAGGEPLKESINSIFQDTLFTDTIIKRMFGNDMTMANLNDGTIEILKWAFHIDGENITSVEVMGNRIGYPREVSRWLQTATFTFNTPINLSSIAVSGVENPDISNSVSNIQDGITYYFDLQEFSEKCANSTYTAGFRHTVNDETLDETNQAYFDLCMRLAVEAGLIDSNTNLSFVSGQMTSGSNSAWGSTYEVPVKAIDLNTNTYYEITGIFDNNMDTSMTALERMVDAIDRGEFRLNGGAQSKIISGDIIYEFEDALDGIVKYTISAENQK